VSDLAANIQHSTAYIWQFLQRHGSLVHVLCIGLLSSCTCYNRDLLFINRSVGPAVGSWTCMCNNGLIHNMVRHYCSTLWLNINKQRWYVMVWYKVILWK